MRLKLYVDHILFLFQEIVSSSCCPFLKQNLVASQTVKEKELHIFSFTKVKPINTLKKVTNPSIITDIRDDRV